MDCYNNIMGANEWKRQTFYLLNYFLLWPPDSRTKKNLLQFD